VYPPAAFVSTLPFALPPYAVAAVLWAVVQAAAVVAALLVCGVRDWRCVALALASPPVVVGLVYGNVSLVVTLCVALVWIARDRPARAGVLLGVVIAARIFLAPLVVWLLLTGRRRSAVWTIGTSVAASLVGWAAVGFRHIGDFPQIAADNVSAFADQGESLSAVVANAGASPQAISAAGLIACLLALGFAWRHRANELACFTWALCAALLLSPIVWVHYYALLLVPIACASPSLSTAWLLPYVSVLQMTAWATTAMRVVSASTGVLLTLAVGRLSLRPVPVASGSDAPTPEAVQGQTASPSSTDAVGSQTG
jgi:alpha-1,2-mannosyltransferase